MLAPQVKVRVAQHKDYVRGVAFAGNSKRAVSCGDDGQLILMERDEDHGGPVFRVVAEKVAAIDASGETSALLSASFSADSQWVACGGQVR